MTYVASRAYRAARREAEELEDVEVGVTCHVSRVTCHDDICIRVVMLQSCARSPPASTATAVSTPPPRGR